MSGTRIIMAHDRRAPGDLKGMAMLQINRRHLLATAAAGAVAGFAGPLPSHAQAATPVTLTAGRRTLEVNGRAATVFALTQDNGTPGLFTEVGTPFNVTLRNDAGVGTLVHWHGLAPPYRQDGVPGISAPAVPPGGTAQYNFPLAFPGTFWMHSHQGLQEQSLMSAPLIVRERGGVGDRQEVVLMLHDFSFTTPDEIYASLRRPNPSSAGPTAGGMAGMAMGESADAGSPGMAMMGQSASAEAPSKTQDLNDVSYDAFLANDRTLDDPQVVRVEPRGRVLLRVINGSAASNFWIDLGQVQARLVAVDGHPVRALSGSMFPVAVAQRLDLELELANQAAAPVLAVLEGSHRRTGIVLATASGQVPRLGSLALGAAAALGNEMEWNLRATAPLGPKPTDRIHQVDLTGDMGSYVWGLNGRAYGQDKPLMVARGQRVELVMTNRTMMSHPMHLHGHFFQVVAMDGQRFAGAVRDTVLVPPMQSVTVAFDADNPGRWAFHCHNAYHMAAGMMTTVQYEAF